MDTIIGLINISINECIFNDVENALVGGIVDGLN
jgi:hypothetical protein